MFRERKQQITFTAYLCNDEVVEGVCLRYDEVFFHVHELVGSHGSQLGEVGPQNLECLLEEVVDGLRMMWQSFLAA